MHSPRTHTHTQRFIHAHKQTVRAHTASISALRGNQNSRGDTEQRCYRRSHTPKEEAQHTNCDYVLNASYTVVFLKIMHGHCVSISIFGAKWFGLSATDIFRRLSAKTTRIWNWDERNTRDYYYYHFECWEKRKKHTHTRQHPNVSYVWIWKIFTLLIAVPWMWNVGRAKTNESSSSVHV